jgi:hypothetical protein
LNGWFDGRLEWTSGGTTLFAESGPFFAVRGDDEVILFLDGNGDAASFRRFYEDPGTTVFTAPDLMVSLYKRDQRRDRLVLQQRHVPDGAALWAKHSEDALQLGLDLAAERAARAAADQALQASIDAEARARAAADADLLTALNQALTAERDARLSEDQSLRNSLGAEMQTRLNADAALQDSIAVLQGSLAAEVQARTQADAQFGSLNASNLVSGTVPGARLSGRYAIDISGNAATATMATTATTATTATNFTGTLAGDVNGSQASTVITGLRGVRLSSNTPVSGQVLGFDGSIARWTTLPPPSGGLTLPYNATVALSLTAFSINNVSGGAAQFTGGQNGAGAVFFGGSGMFAAGDGLVASGGSAAGATNGGGAGGVFHGGSGTTGGAPGIIAQGGRLPFGGGISAPGIIAIAGGGSDPVAGQFFGDVDVTGVLEVRGDVRISGSLSANSKAFKIDHPLDPGRKYLTHSVVESPEMLNIYNGTALLDAEGEAVVQMPDWFEALNRDFRYQLTAIGAPGPNLFIAQEVAQNRFKIAGGKPGTKVSWQVTGVRHDAYAKIHPIRVEEDKPEAERGRYLHPEAFGQVAR